MVVYGVLTIIQEDEVKTGRVDTNSTFESCFDLLFGCSLAASAYYLSKFMSQFTEKKQNTCLLVWHIVNVFVMTAVYVSIALISVGIYRGWGDSQTLGNYREVGQLASTFVDFYVDLFLLWLLYRFMRPEKETSSYRKSSSFC